MVIAEKQSERGESSPENEEFPGSTEKKKTEKEGRSIWVEDTERRETHGPYKSSLIKAQSYLNEPKNLNKS